MVHFSQSPNVRVPPIMHPICNRSFPRSERKKNNSRKNFARPPDPVCSPKKKFSEKLLSDNEGNHVQPAFSKEQAHQFFTNTYKSLTNEDFCQPAWMPDIPLPDVPFYHGSITHEELALTLKKCLCGSSPNPLDGIPYTILKRCPSIHPALLHLFNTCLMKSQVQAQWKAAVIKLIPKPKAQNCASDP